MLGRRQLRRSQHDEPGFPRPTGSPTPSAPRRYWPMPRDTRGRLRAWSRCGRSWTPAGAWTAWSCEHRGSFPDALEHHHRDPPVRLALVVVIGGPDLGHQLPQPFPLRPLGRAGPGPEPDVLDRVLDRAAPAAPWRARCWFPPARGTLSSAPSRSDRPGQLAERLSHLVQSFFRDPSLCYITA